MRRDSKSVHARALQTSNQTESKWNDLRSGAFSSMSSRVSREDRWEISRRLQRKQNTKDHCELEGMRKSSELLFSDAHKPPFTSRAVPLDINQFCSVLLTFLNQFDPKQKQTYSIQASVTKQKLKLPKCSSSVCVFRFSFLQGFTTHLTRVPHLLWYGLLCYKCSFLIK